MKKTDGFTLVELMVGILCSAIVTGAIITFMLMGMKTNRTVIDANVNQRNARIVISLMEDLASEGSIKELQVDGSLTTDDDGNYVDAGTRSWVLRGEGGDLLSYSPATKTIYTQGDSVLMEGVKASMLTMSTAPLGGCLLGFGLQTEDAFYQTSAYCRASTITPKGLILDNNNFEIIDSERTEDEPDLKPDFSATEEGRKAFLEVLTSQYGSTGMIIHNGVNTLIPYSLWYQGGAYPENDPKWNENTPWCAIFLSWGFASTGNGYLETIHKEANVDKLWTALDDDTVINDPANPPSDIHPGDLIFFNWDADSTLEHVGAVFYIDDNFVYTIEGNSSGRVALRKYEVRNSCIYGYGVLDWKSLP